MSKNKRRWTITIDPAVAEALGGDEEALAGAVGEFVHDQVERRDRAEALVRLLRRMVAERGPVDEREVDDFSRLSKGGTLVLDAESLSVLAQGREQERTVRAALTALGEGADAIVPAAVLVELYSGPMAVSIDSWLGSEGGIAVMSTDRPLARRTARILADAGRGADDHLSACLVAACAISGGGVILTRDERKVAELSAGAADIEVRSVAPKWRPALFGSAAAR